MIIGSAVWLLSIMYSQFNLFNVDTQGTEPSVRFTEVSVL